MVELNLLLCKTMNDHYRGFYLGPGSYYQDSPGSSLEWVANLNKIKEIQDYLEIFDFDYNKEFMQRYQYDISEHWRHRALEKYQRK